MTQRKRCRYGRCPGNAAAPRPGRRGRGSLRRHGRCGKCRVMVQGALSSPDPRETSLLGAAALRRGVRLACLTTVEGDCTVTLGADRAVRVIRSDGTMPSLPRSPFLKSTARRWTSAPPPWSPGSMTAPGPFWPRRRPPTPARLRCRCHHTHRKVSGRGARVPGRCIRDRDRFPAASDVGSSRNPPRSGGHRSSHRQHRHAISAHRPGM